MKKTNLMFLVACSSVFLILLFSLQTKAGELKSENWSEPNEEKTPHESFVDAGSSNVSTAQNTYGVDTVENPAPKIYLSPFAGMTSNFGNTTVNLDPSYAAGVSVGLLISDHMTLEASFIHAEQGVSSVNTPYPSLGASSLGEVYSLTQNQFDLGTKLFFLGRESKIRPYFNGGIGYIKNALNYQSGYLQAAENQGYGTQDFLMNQFTGFGGLGVEYAFTKMIVMNAMFKVDGVFSSNSSYDASGKAVDLDKVTAGNSLSHTSSYTFGAGLGIYF